MSVILLVRDWLSRLPMTSPDNYITELILAVAIFLTCYTYRKSLLKQRVSFKELMLLGIGLGVVSTVIFGLWTWWNLSHFASALVDYYNEERIALMEPAETSEEARLAIEQVKNYTAGHWAFIGAFRLAVISIIITFFAALLFHNEKGTERKRS